MLKKNARPDRDTGASPHLLGLREELAASSMKAIVKLPLGRLALEVVQGRDSVWVLAMSEGDGGLAMRAAYIPGGVFSPRVEKSDDRSIQLSVVSHLGTHSITLTDMDPDLGRVRIRTALQPSAPLTLGYVPRDIYPLGPSRDPFATRGVLQATQRGLNTALVYFRIAEPEFGCVLYLQDLTSLNRYYQATGTKPDGVVGGEWPELGYLAPTQRKDGSTKPLIAGEEVIISDAVVVMRPCEIQSETDSARHFLQMLAAAYTTLDRPSTEYRDWVWRAERTLADLDSSPKATLKKYAARFARPYTDAEYPDSMVQLSLLTAMHDYGTWRGEPHPIEASFRKGVRKFFDPEIGCLRRYLPDVGDDKNADAVDSWYLYHPLLNLAYLALSGDREAKKLLLRCVDFGIKAAHHFEYRWPIQYNVRDFSVITGVAADGRGQTDVGGIYAQLMLLTHELSGEERFLEEAKDAIKAAEGLRFNLNYQANLTAWGAAACMRLWRLTREESYLQQSYVYLASFFHNAEMWESDLNHATHYRNFLGVTCLQDAPYMAIYECFDSFAAFECYLSDAGSELDPAARLLIGEYCRYALDRAWYYYPDALPPEVLADSQRNGHIDRKLSFPLEDLYADGQPAGQVGQEIYGSGAAWVFASRSFHRLGDAPFLLHCDHFLFSTEMMGPDVVRIQLPGDERGRARISLVRKARTRKQLPSFTLRDSEGVELKASDQEADRVSFDLPANAQVVLSWT